MTSALILPVNIEEYDFDIPCEDIGCVNPAIVMCKGCSDSRHFAICAHHQALLIARFEQRQFKVICSGCNRPWGNIELHYDMLTIRESI